MGVKSCFHDISIREAKGDHALKRSQRGAVDMSDLTFDQIFQRLADYETSGDETGANNDILRGYSDPIGIPTIGVGHNLLSDFNSTNSSFQTLGQVVGINTGSVDY